MRVHREWEREGFDNARLSGIAARALAESALAERGTVESLCQWCFETGEYPRQPNELAMFGQPPMTIYADDRLYIEVLFWLENTTTIHQHAFSGAFYVLAGPSIHSVYRFEEHERLSPHLLIGDVTLERFEQLEVGSVQPINAGTSYIHSLFHLGYPSITVVVRNVVEKDKSPQFNYLPPALAIDDHVTDVHLLRQGQLFGMLDTIGHPQASAMLTRWLSRANAEASIRLLLSLFKRGRLTDAQLDEAVALVSERHGPAVGGILRPVFDEALRVDRLVARRQTVTDKGARLLLALMILAPGREAARDVIQTQYPGQNPSTLIFGWIQALNAAGAGLSFHEIQTMFVGADAVAA